MFHLLYIFFVSSSLLSFGDFLLKCMLMKEERIKLYNSLSQVQCYNHFYLFIFFNTTETRGPLSIKAYEGILRPTGLPFEDLRSNGGSLYVYGKLPTYPSPKPILINTYFSLRAKCWLRGEVGGQRVRKDELKYI